MHQQQRIALAEQLGLQERTPDSFEPFLVTGRIDKVTPDCLSVRVQDPQGDSYRALLPITEVTQNKPVEPGGCYTMVQLQPGPDPIVSLNSPLLLELLIDGVCPEVRQGQVRVMNIARVAGNRAKVAVAATAAGTDPVRALLGRSNCRVQTLSGLLRGERIEVVAYSNDPATFVRNALGNHVIDEVRVNGGLVEVFVPETQLKPVLGGGGLNAELAAKVTDTKLAIRPTQALAAAPGPQAEPATT